ncbi:MAG TPA: hypothetical protein VM529_27160 [Gemmata sp.]|nr:hypothetical protein [Gemmata sp.]
MTKAVFLAGVLGGLLGGVAAYAAARMFPAPPAGDTAAGGAQASAPEARQVVEGFLGKLRDGKYPEFVEDVKRGRTFMSEAEFEAFKKSFVESRKVYHGGFGNLTGEYDLIRETVLRPDLVRYVYIEKFERGSLVWLFVIYKTKDGWRLNTISWNPDLIHAFPAS